MRRNHFIFLTPGIYQDEGSGQKAELDIADMPVRPQIPRVAEQEVRSFPLALRPTGNKAGPLFLGFLRNRDGMSVLGQALW